MASDNDISAVLYYRLPVLQLFTTVTFGKLNGEARSDVTYQQNLRKLFLSDKNVKNPHTHTAYLVDMLVKGFVELQSAKVTCSISVKQQATFFKKWSDKNW